jgi:outer membrane immunogenic protein
VGYGWAQSRGTAAGLLGGFPAPYNSNPSGVTGGGFIGGNYQIQNFVLGIEADWQASDLHGTGIGADMVGDLVSVRTRINDYGSVRGRVGLTMDRWMIFATGGVAWGSWDTSYRAVVFPTPYFTNSVSEHVGWTVGAGLEYAFPNNWLARVEYRYTDLGTKSYVDSVSESSELGNRVTINDLRVGLAYKFGGPIVAR